MTDDYQDPEVMQDFLAWCERDRLLGRDRLWPAFRAGWAFGYATATDRLAEQQRTKDSDQ